jgi:hypothetical protein
MRLPVVLLLPLVLRELGQAPRQEHPSSSPSEKPKNARPMAMAERAAIATRGIRQRNHKSMNATDENCKLYSISVPRCFMANMGMRRYRRVKLRPNATQRSFGYFLRDLAASDCIRPFMLGAAAITFAFSFFGFLVSRFPRCSPLAMDQSSGPERA